MNFLTGNLSCAIITEDRRGVFSANVMDIVVIDDFSSPTVKCLTSATP